MPGIMNWVIINLEDIFIQRFLFSYKIGENRKVLICSGNEDRKGQKWTLFEYISSLKPYHRTFTYIS